MSKYSYTDEQLRDAVRKSLSIAGVCRELGIRPVGGNYKTLKERFKKLGLDTSYFTGKAWNVGIRYRPLRLAIALEEILVENSTYTNSNSLRKRLIKEGIKEYKCECCGNTHWQGKDIPLELHHVNGNNTDNRIENLQLLCPNCHAITDNFRGRNQKSFINELHKKEYEEHKNDKPVEKVIPEPKKRIIQRESKICQQCGGIYYGSNLKFCSSKCSKEYQSRNIPSKEQLTEDFKELKNFTQVGKKYGKSDRMVSKWCAKRGLPTHSSEMKEYLKSFDN